jgi:hypothetical protein
VVYGVFAKHFFGGNFFNGFFVSSEKQIKFVTSTAATAVQSKSNSHVNVYYLYTTSPLSSPLFALCVRCFVFEEEKELP